MNQDENKIEQNINNEEKFPLNKDINNEGNNPTEPNPVEEPTVKKNNAPLIIILVLAFLAIGISIVGMVVKSWVKDDIKPKDEDKTEVTDNQNNEVEIYDEPQIDPYENFKNLIWSTSESDEVKIKDNAVYYGDTKLDLEMEGTYKSLEVVKSPYSAKVYLLTEEGEVWSFNVYFMTGEGEVDNVTRHLSDTKILDMVYRDTNTIECVYFLTEKGELIDINKIPYDKYDFVGIVSTYGGSAKLPYDSNNYLYHWNEKSNEYEQIQNKSKQKITANKIIELASSEGILIYTSHGNMYKYDTKSNIATQVDKDIKSIDFYVFDNTGSINMVVTYDEGPKTVNYDVSYVYDMSKTQLLDLENLKTFDPYSKHKSITWVKSNASVGEGTTYRSVYCEDDDSAYLVIGDPYTDVKQLTLIEGTPVKAHIFTTMSAILDREVTEAYVLTEDGKVYEVNTENGMASQVTNLEKYNIIDMACIGEEYKTMCFLTDAGDLLTVNANIFEY